MNLTIGKLKAMINALPDDMPVVRIDHFGNPESYESLWCVIQVLNNMQYFVIEPPDIGPEPG